MFLEIQPARSFFPFSRSFFSCYIRVRSAQTQDEEPRTPAADRRRPGSTQRRKSIQHQKEVRERLEKVDRLLHGLRRRHSPPSGTLRHRGIL